MVETCNKGIDLDPRHGTADFEAGALDISQELRVLQHTIEGTAMSLDQSLGKARRRKEYPSHSALSKEESQGLALCVGLGEIENGRNVRKFGMFRQEDDE